MHTVAVKTDGTLWSWGEGATGRLGHGNTTDRSSPVQVGALTTWAAASAGGDFSGAIKTDGTLWTWGRNTSGRLGLGNTTDYSSPKQVGALTSWSLLSCGFTSHTLVIKTNGTLWGFGSNVNGELGQGNTTANSSPVQVGALTSWLLPVAMDRSSLGTKS